MQPARGLLRRLYEKFGGLDWINNAGVLKPINLRKIELDELREHFAVNVEGVISARSASSARREQQTQGIGQHQLW